MISTSSGTCSCVLDDVDVADRLRAFSMVLLLREWVLGFRLCVDVLGGTSVLSTLGLGGRGGAS